MRIQIGLPLQIWHGLQTDVMADQRQRDDERLPLPGHVLVVSGRTSFEIVQKAWLAGIEILCAVSAPSSLAVEVAQEAGITLIGFARAAGFNIYSHPGRVVS